MCASVLKAGPVYTVSASGFTTTDRFTWSNPLEFSYVTYSNGAKSVTGSGSSAWETLGIPRKVAADGAASGSAFAGPGVLQASAGSLAFVLADQPYLPAASASFSAEFDDDLTPVSSTLPIGSPISVHFTIHLDFTSTGASNREIWGDLGHVHANFWFGGTPPAFPQKFVALNFTPVFAPSLPKSGVYDYGLDVTGTVGSPMAVSAFLGVDTLDYAGPDVGLSTHTAIDASHTLRLFADPSTPDFQLTSDSGHNYSLNPNPEGAVPEPASLTLWGIGMTIVAGWRFARRKSDACAMRR
jgi:hypothetical protein